MRQHSSQQKLEIFQVAVGEETQTCFCLFSHLQELLCHLPKYENVPGASPATPFQLCVLPRDHSSSRWEWSFNPRPASTFGSCPQTVPVKTCFHPYTLDPLATSYKWP